jgi:transposase
MYYIGMDCHIANLEFAVVNKEGKVIKRDRVTTSGRGMMDFIRQVPRPRIVIVEEGCLAAWVKEVCEMYQEKVIISDPKENRWIARAGKKRDAIDAEKLAQLARGNFLKEIYHPVGEKRRLRELVLAYHDMVSMEIRLKNKIKAKYRQNGVPCVGRTVYSSKHRALWRKKLPPHPVPQLILENFWNQLDQARKCRLEVLMALRREKKNYPEIERFMALDGIGLIHGMTIYALVETPYRFATKKRLFGYFGLGIDEQSSGDKVYHTSLNKQYNPRLKATIKQATESAIRKQGGPFQQHYHHLILEEGMVSHRAKLTVSRSMVAALYAMWLTGKEYDPTRQQRDRARYLSSGQPS